MYVGIQLDLVNDRFRCHLCRTSWLGRRSLGKHLTTKLHLDNENAARLRAEEANIPSSIYEDVDDFEPDRPVSPVLPMHDERASEISTGEPDSANFEFAAQDDDDMDMEDLDFDDGHFRMDDWFPYESKPMALLDVLDNMPRRKLSDSTIKLLIFVLKECNVPDVPSFNTFRKRQKALRDAYGVRAREVPRGEGKSFFANDLRNIIGRDWSSPQTRPHINLYPDIPTGGMAEIWDGSKLRKHTSPNLLPPMWVHPTNGLHFYVGEISQDDQGNFGLLKQWLRRPSVVGPAGDVVLATPLRKGIEVCFTILSFKMYELRYLPRNL